MAQRGLYVLFFIAGIPALIYQVAWQRALGLHIGVDAYSTTITVATFMAGLGGGAVLGGRLAARVARPMALYGKVELGLGLIGLASPWLITVTGQGVAGASLPVTILGAVVVLALPTTLMGATLPIMSRIVVDNDATIGRRLSVLYGVNTLGAALGACLTSFVLIGSLGIEGACRCAAGINLLLAVVMLVRAKDAAPGERRTGDPLRAAPRAVIVLAFVSGLVALGFEIVAYRLLGVILHGTVYVFGTILTVFLLGITAGSLASRRWIDRPDPLRRFAWSQLISSGYLLGFCLILGFGSQLPGIRHVLSASFFTSFHPSTMLRSQHDLATIYSLVDVPLWSVAILGVPTFMMGFGFPHLMRAAALSVDGVSIAVGRVYGANILGSILGTLVVGFVTLGAIGSEHTLHLLILVGAISGALAAWHVDRRVGAPMRLGAIIVVVVALVALVAPSRLMHSVHVANARGVDFEVREDATGVVALRTQREIIAFAEEAKILGQTKLYIDGAAHGHVGEEPSDWTVALALAAAPAPHRVLSIGLGDGVLCDSVLDDPTVSELVIVELNGQLLDLLRTTPRGARIAASPKVRYLVDDGRRWLHAHRREAFDLIMTWPLHPAHAGYGNLFSVEFLELASEHLRPGGVYYTRTTDAFSTARTLAESAVSVIRVDGSAYIATFDGPLRVSRSAAPVSADLLASHLEADAETILANTADDPINTDLRPRSEYYLSYSRAWALLGSDAVYQLAPGERATYVTRYVQN